MYEIVRPGRAARTMRSASLRQALVVIGMTLLAIPLAAALASVLPGLILEFPPIVVALGLALVMRFAFDRQRVRGGPLHLVDCS